MNRYNIGNLAEKIVAIKVRKDGTVTPHVRHRLPSGRMVDVLRKTDSLDRFHGTVDFVARVAKGDAGVVSLDPVNWYSRYSIAAIPLGGAEPFCDHEVEFGSNTGEYSGREEVRFHLEDGKLTWESENVSGEAVINETYPELNVILRLPPGAEGEIEFASPVFGREGEHANRLLSAA